MSKLTAKDYKDIYLKLRVHYEEKQKMLSDDSLFKIIIDGIIVNMDALENLQTLEKVKENKRRKL